MTKITDIDFTIEQQGTGVLEIYINDNKPAFIFSDGSMHFGQIKEVNNLKIIFNKEDPADTSSFAKIKNVSINNTDFTEFFKTLDYTINQTLHPNTEKTIKNLYLKECFEALTKNGLMVEEFPDDLGEFLKGINYAITEAKEIK